MKRIARLTFTLAPLLLFACQNQNKYDENLAKEKNGLSLFQHGEGTMASSQPTGEYTPYVIEDDGTKILEALDQGENVFILQSAGDCGHCQKLQPILSGFLSQYSVKTYLLYAEKLSESSTIRDAFAKISAVYPSVTYTPAFPRATLISSDIEVDGFFFSGYTTSIHELSTLLLTKFHHENIVEFQNKENFDKALKDHRGVGYMSPSFSSFIQNDMKDITAKEKNLSLYKIEEGETFEEGYYAYRDGLVKISKEEALKNL